ncbi:hypothetical protein AAE478_001978 [Parahypoxylon ruwenzoriense]
MTNTLEPRINSAGPQAPNESKDTQVPKQGEPSPPKPPTPPDSHDAKDSAASAESKKSKDDSIDAFIEYYLVHSPPP